MKGYLSNMNTFKKRLKKTWLGKLIINKQSIKEISIFPGSKKYWENRYTSNRDSGPGSYGRLANYKADVLNNFVKEKKVQSVIEYGCGDGNQLSLANYPSYIGFDVSSKALELCVLKFEKDKTKSFYQVQNETSKDFQAELVLSLDVLFHLIEDKVFNDYMWRLFNSSSDYVIIYSSNYKEQIADHVKSRQFTKWIENNVSRKWELLDFIKNKYPFNEKDPDNTSISDFYFYIKK